MSEQPTAQIDLSKPAIQVMGFHTEYSPDPGDPSKNRAIDFVTWVKIGDASGASNVERVDLLKPRTRRAKTYKNHLGQERFLSGRQLQAAPEWLIVEPHYEAWKKGEKLPDIGTLIISWPGADRRLSDALKKINILTLEEFVNAGPAIMERVPMPGIQRLQLEADNFLKAQKDGARVAAALTQSNDELKRQADIIANLQRKIEAMEGAKPEEKAEQPEPEKPAEPTIDDYDVEWGGPIHKWRVLKGGEIVEKGFDNKEAGIQWAVKAVSAAV